MIICPHCNGTGMVPDDFLTDEFVVEVFRDFVDTFLLDIELYVDRYSVRNDEDGNAEVFIEAKFSNDPYGYKEDYYSLPMKFFTRNESERMRLLHEEREKRLIVEKERVEEVKLAEIERIERRAAILKGEIGND